MKHWRITNWCNIAVCNIHYPPDRKAVFEELQQHLDERSDDYLEKGYEEKEAVLKALEDMGDAKELAPILGAIHRPFWGYAYAAAKVLASILVATLVLVISAGILNYLIFTRYAEPYYSNYNPYIDTTGKGATRLGLWEQSDSFTFGGYTYKLEKCALWDQGDYGKDIIYARIRITNYLPWAAKPNLDQNLDAIDNLSKYYVSASRNYTGQPSLLLTLVKSQSAPFEWVMDIMIFNTDFDGVEWIDIHSHACSNFALRIDLTGGVFQ